ncbi:MAG: hypothetical protein OEZ28_11195 [Nitrospinota bacterium]|nr:hypothetical protein [Nitrospinota bacterium]
MATAVCCKIHLMKTKKLAIWLLTLAAGAAGAALLVADGGLAGGEYQGKNLHQFVESMQTVCRQDYPCGHAHPKAARRFRPVDPSAFVRQNPVGQTITRHAKGEYRQHRPY